MFFYTIYKSEIWKDLEVKDRNLRILIFGSFFYVIVHSYIFSKYVENNQYKKYFYYVPITDLLLTLIDLFNKGKEFPSKKTKNRKYNVPVLALPNKNLQPNSKCEDDASIPIYNKNNDDIPVYKSKKTSE